MLKEELFAILQRAVDRGELAGCNLLVTRNGEPLVQLAAGYADIQSAKPVAYNSVFRLYSQTKPITAAAAALLMERGQLDVCQWVQDFLPGFRNQTVWNAQGEPTPVQRGVSVMDLLRMTAGLSYPGGRPEEEPVCALFERNQAAIRAGGGMSTQALCNALGQIPLAFQPGTAYKYSTCADVLGAVIEVVDGRPFSRLLREEFFEPLSMPDTGFCVTDSNKSRLVTCYQRTGEGLQPYHQLHLCVGDYSREPAFASGGAGLVSTLEDYSHFAQMLLNKGVWKGRRILREATVDWLTSPQLSPAFADTLGDSLSGYSYGKLMRVCVNPGQAGGLSRLGEYGWDGWLGTYFANFPREGITLLMNQNTTDTGTAPVTRRVRNRLLASL